MFGQKIQQIQALNLVILKCFCKGKILKFTFLYQQTFKIYNDQSNNAFATLVSNSDLNSMGVNTNGANYRVVSMLTKKY